MLTDEEVEKNTLENACYFIFLNKTGYGGMYRESSTGEFNIPYGKKKAKNTPTIYNRDNIINISRLIQRVHFIHSDFTDSLKNVKENDFVYLDPPYVPISQTANFTDYTEGGFDHDDQVRLRDMAQRLKDKGVHVYLSNSGAELVRELYKDWTIEEFSLKRTLGVASKEKTASELRSEDIPELLIF